MRIIHNKILININVNVIINNKSLTNDQLVGGRGYLMNIIHNKIIINININVIINNKSLTNDQLVSDEEARLRDIAIRERALVQGI